MEVGDALAKRSPRMLTIGFSVVDGAKNLERRGLGDGRFDAQNGGGLVVHLDGISCDPMLDPNPFGPVLKTGYDLAGEPAMGFLAEESSMITPKPATNDHPKTGHHGGAETVGV